MDSKFSRENVLTMFNDGSNDVEIAFVSSAAVVEAEAEVVAVEVGDVVTAVCKK